MAPITLENIPLDDEKTWKLIQSGQTRGVFQCESKLVQHWLKKIKPHNLWELSAVIALVRPGALESGFADKYVKNKFGDEEIESFGHPIIDDIFAPTHGILCVEENVKVKLSNGKIVPIKDIKISDSLISLNLDNRKFEHDVCMGHAQTKKGEGLKITLKNGQSVTVTKDHKVLTFEGWKEAQNLDIENDIVASANSFEYINFHTSKIEVPEICENEDNFGYLLGMLLADGYLKETLNIACGSKERAEIVAAFINDNFKLESRVYFNTRCWYASVCRHGGKKLGCVKNQVKQWLQKENLKQDCYNKFVPECILTASREVKKQFLAGFFDGDGHISIHKESEKGINCHFTTVSQNLLDGLSTIMTEFGIDHRMIHPRIHVLNQEKLKEVIGKYTKIKDLMNFNTLSKAERYGVIPSSYISNICLEENMGWKPFCRKYHLGTKNKKFASPSRYKKFYNAGDIKYFNIVKIEKVDNCVFYDIGVKNNHNFVGNGIILSNCYQESLIVLARKLAWPHLPEKENLLKADALRKAVGKKDQVKILAIGKEFVEGCLHNKVEPEIANKLFEVIKNCGRYLFNLSHSFKYAMVAYFSAYLKAHYPAQFFTTYLSYAKFKATINKFGKEISSKWIETKDLYVDGIKFDINLIGPNINNHNVQFRIAEEGSNKILFAIPAIKWCSSLGNKLHSLPKIDNWQKFLLLTTTEYYGFCTDKRAAEALIRSGSFRDVNLSRSCLSSLFEFSYKMTATEQKIMEYWLVENKDAKLPLSTFVETVKEKVLPKARKDRKLKLQQYIDMLPKDLEVVDHPAAIEEWEKDLLGVAITATSLDAKESASNTCDECVQDRCKPWEKKVLHVKINDIKFTTTKTGANPGQKMAIIDVSDYTGNQSFPVFPEQFNMYEEFLMIDNMIRLDVINGKRGFVVEQIEQLL